MLLSFSRDKRAGSGSITFIVIFMILVVIVVQFVEPINLAFSDLMLTLSYKKGLDAMQQEGRLTPEIESSIKSFLKKYGFDEDRIEVNGTTTPVDWGGNLMLSISYAREYTKYEMNGLLGIQSEVETARSLIEGSTTSYYSE